MPRRKSPDSGEDARHRNTNGTAAQVESIQVLTGARDERLSTPLDVGDGLTLWVGG